MRGFRLRNSLKKVIILTCTLYLLTVLVSCTGVPARRVVFSYVDQPMKAKPIPIKVGIRVFEDARSKDEREEMSKLGNIERDVTKFFEYPRVFSEVEWEYKPEDVDIILKGTIKSFQWEAVDYSLVFALTLWIWPLVGGPVGHVSAHAGIEVSLENAHTGEVIGTYFEEEKFYKAFSTYSQPIYFTSQGLELWKAIWQVAGKIQGRILADRDKILRSLNRSD